MLAIGRIGGGAALSKVPYSVCTVPLFLYMKLILKKTMAEVVTYQIYKI